MNTTNKGRDPGANEYCEPDDTERATYARAGREVAAPISDPLAEYRAERRRERAAVIGLAELRRMTRDVVVNDAEALVTTPAYSNDDFIDDMRRYVSEMKIWRALHDLGGGKVLHGDFDDAVAVWYHDGGNIGDIARRVLAGEFGEHDRHANLDLRWPDDSEDDD